MAVHIVHHDGGAVVGLERLQADVVHGQSIDMTDVKAPCGQLFVLRELRIGLGHFRHLVELVETPMGIIRVAPSGKHNLDVFERHILDFTVFQSNDPARGDVSRQILHRTLVLITRIGFSRRHLAIHVPDDDTIHETLLVAPGTDVQVNGVAHVDGMQRVHQDVLTDASIHTLDGDGAAVSVVHPVVDNLHVLETSRAHGAELDAAGRAAGRAVAHFNVLA